MLRNLVNLVINSTPLTRMMLIVLRTFFDATT